jgi:hypothetical protein
MAVGKTDVNGKVSPSYRAAILDYGVGICRYANSGSELKKKHKI